VNKRMGGRIAQGQDPVHPVLRPVFGKYHGVLRPVFGKYHGAARGVRPSGPVARVPADMHLRGDGSTRSCAPPP
jgi:hypothetical protein